MSSMWKGITMSMSDYKSVLVTGASGLMGQALVEAFASSGLTVHAMSRNSAQLEELSSRTGCIVHAVDIADTRALEAIVPQLQVDVLVNNAGTAAAGSVHDGDPAAIDAQVDVNLRAVMHLSRLVLPGMIERDRGHIVTISSMSGHYNFPGHAAYHATKAAIQTFCRQLRIDLFGQRIRVTEISPGRVKTEMFSKALGLDSGDAEGRFFDGYETLLPSDVADAVLYAVGSPRRVNVSLIDLLPTMQVPGGIRIAQARSA